MTAVTTAGAYSVMSSQSISASPLRHHAGDVEQRRRRGIGRDHAGERREEQREQEEHRDEHAGQPGAAAGLRRRPRSRYSSWWSRCRSARRTWPRSCRRPAPASCAAACRRRRGSRRDERRRSSVPALSNTSTNRKLNITIRTVSSNTREKSSCRNVGASDGGIETMPPNLREPERHADQRSRRGCRSTCRRGSCGELSATISTKPSSARIAGQFLQIAERHQRRRMVDHDAWPSAAR